MAQNLTFNFKGTVENIDLGKNEPGVSVAIVQNGSSIATATTASNGKYNLKGSVNYTKPFSVVFSKSGLVSKKVDFNLVSLNEEDIPAGSEYQPISDLSMKMFAERPEVDFSFLNTEPVAKFDWNQSKAVPELNKVASEKTRIKIEKLLMDADANKNANEAKYQSAIAAADGFYNQKKYVEALAKYEEAIKFKPKEKHPNDRILELDALIQAMKKAALADQQANSEYYNLISAADAFRDQKKYDQAIAKYNEAIAKKDEQYPKDQIIAVEKLKKEAENQGKYQEAVTAADMFYNQKSYMAAKEKYTIANKLKPSEQHPITRLADIEKKLNEQTAAKEKKQKYEDAVAAADLLYNEEKWEEAKTKYKEALTFESSATYPISRIKDCDSKLLAAAKEKEKADKIAKLLVDGGTLFTASKWAEAKIKYNEVLILDALNAEAKQKLDEIALKIAEASDLAAQEAKFTKLVNEGDLAAKGLKYADAQKKYEEALLIKTNPAVQTKLDDVIKKIKELADKETLDAQFQTLKSEGMKLATEQQWLEAKSKLTEAQLIRQDPAIAAKLKEIEAKIQANQALMQLEEDYKNLIAEAETKEAANDLDGAIAKYKEALLKKPKEQMPKDKILELEALKLNSVKQKEIDAKYAAFMKKGKELMAQKNYLGAIKEFNLALEQKPTEKEPSDLAAEAERLEKAKSNEGDEQYEKILTVAQTKMDEKDYVKARELLERAVKIKQADPRPKELILKIDAIEKQQKEYTAKMKEAEVFASAKEYTKAITNFEQAKSIKPDETKPQERIDELNKLITEMSSQKERDQLYKDYMTKGALSQSAKSYEQALSHYQNALSVKENDQIAKDKISEIQQILDDIANAAQNDIDRKNKFDAFILEANSLFEAEKFLEAKTIYTKALGLDGTSLYAKKQIEECDIRQRLKDQSLANSEYNEIIRLANESFDIKSYDKAKENYERALTVRPTDPHPKKRLKEIDAILNPVIVKSSTLEELGDPYDNSIMDGHAALVKADIERKNLKNSKLINTIDGIKESENELSTLKSLEQQTTTNEIYRITNSIAISDEASDLNRQATVDALRRSDVELENLTISNTAYKHAELLRSQETLNLVVENSATDNTIRQNEQTKNATILTNYTTEYADELRLQGEREALMSIEADQKLIGIQEYINQEQAGNYDERKETEMAIGRIVENAEQVKEELSNSKQNELLSNKASIEIVDIKVAEKAQNDSKNASENNETIKEIGKVVVLADQVRSDQQYAHTSEINLKVDQINTSIDESTIERDLNRLNTTEIIHQGSKNLDDLAYEAYNSETEKYLKNKAIINEQVIKNDGVSELADANNASNISTIDLLDKKANTTSNENSMSDEDQRLKAKANVEMHAASVEENATVSTKKQEGNSAKFDDMNRTMNAEDANKGVSQQDKSYSTQAKLNNIENKQPEKVILANSLGQEYPEGVSQESFTQTDENGLMTSVITRRIVVINGHGNVYVRTQTLHAITYTKNGQPATEHLWQKETTGPHLEKHY